MTDQEIQTLAMRMARNVKAGRYRYDDGSRDELWLVVLIGLACVGAVMVARWVVFGLGAVGMWIISQ